MARRQLPTRKPISVPTDRTIMAAIEICRRSETGKIVIVLDSTQRGVVVHMVRTVFRQVETERMQPRQHSTGSELRRHVGRKVAELLDAPDFRRAYVLIVMMLYNIRQHGLETMLRANNMTEADIPEIIPPAREQLELFDKARP